MRLRILSDLHREFGPVDVPDVEADVVILAGDTDRGTRGVTWARQRFFGVPVLYVAGNHEHYGERIGRLHEKLREAAAGSNVTILENDAVTIDGWRFFGATLWTDFQLFSFQPRAMLVAGDRQTGMNDYRKIIRQDCTRLRPKHTAALHADSRLALTSFLEAGDRARSVVITHHAPSPQSLPEDRRNDEISAAYASNLDDLIHAQGPACWIHGHIHTPRDYMIGSTRILNNALGYRGPEEERNPTFREDLVVVV